MFFPFRRFFCLAVLFLLLPLAGGSEPVSPRYERLAAIEARILSFRPDPGYTHDALGLHVVKAALSAAKQGCGGIGACLVDETTGKVVETGRNRQYAPYFRSDLHGEMDLLNRYEDRIRKKRGTPGMENPRDCSGLTLVSSVEPCPMCLTRIINSGVKRVVYLIEDKNGGMVTRMDHLPPFWRKFAADRQFLKADCSPALRQIAWDLFHLSDRGFAGKGKTPAP